MFTLNRRVSKWRLNLQGCGACRNTATCSCADHHPIKCFSAEQHSHRFSSSYSFNIPTNISILCPYLDFFQNWASYPCRFKFNLSSDWLIRYLPSVSLEPFLVSSAACLPIVPHRLALAYCIALDNAVSSQLYCSLYWVLAYLLCCFT